MAVIKVVSIYHPRPRVRKTRYVASPTYRRNSTISYKHPPRSLVRVGCSNTSSTFKRGNVTLSPAFESAPGKYLRKVRWILVCAVSVKNRTIRIGLVMRLLLPDCSDNRVEFRVIFMLSLYAVDTGIRNRQCFDIVKFSKGRSEECRVKALCLKARRKKTI